MPENESTDFVLVDSPGKKRTLSFIKIFIACLIAALVFYGTFFDKWALKDTNQQPSRETPGPSHSQKGEKRKMRKKKSIKRES